MKFFYLLLLAIFTTSMNSVWATNPGNNIGCLRWNVKFYTNYWKDENSAPYNPRWVGPFHYYDAKGASYAVDYGPGGCGTINPGNSSQYKSLGCTCFIYDGGIYYQGELGTYNNNNVSTCDFDEGVTILFIMLGLASVRKLLKWQAI